MSRSSARLVRSPHHTLVRPMSGKRNRRRFLTLENLEGRSLMALLVADALLGTADTTVSGTVYEDLNSNGMRDGGEDGITGWQVYIDLDNSGTLNTDAAGTLEPSAVTNTDGDYIIRRLIPGVYRVGEVVAEGWTPTSPVSQDVLVSTGRDTRADFFNFRGGDILGTVWNDTSADGVRDAGELGLAGWTVYLDLSTDGVLDPTEPTTTTDAEGKYLFTDIPAGDYEVTEVLPDGWDVSPGFDIKQTAGVVGGQQFTQDFANFSTSNGSIQGVVWNDTNANGLRESDPTTGEFTEPGLADWTVFIDYNNDGIVDSGEPSVLTDANGNYTFVSLNAGDYEVTEVLPEGWDVSPTFDSRQTVAVVGGEVSTAADFANFTILNGSIQGTVWNDINRNGIRDFNTITGLYTDPGLPGWTILLDLNRNHIADAGEPTTLTDVNGTYAFLDLQVGDYEVQEFLPTGWEVATTFSDNYTVTVFSGSDSIAPDFANFNVATSSPGSVSGVVWNDVDGDGARDAGDTGLAGWTVFVDSNADGVLTTGEVSVTTASNGEYTITNITAGSVRIVVQGTAGWRGTSPITNARTISLRSGEAAVGLDFGEAELKDSTIRGTVYADSDKDGTRDAGDRGLAAITVYLDANNNGQHDVGELETQTSADLFYTPAVDEAGSYSFTHLAKGSYSVRAILPATLSATPAAQLEHTITIVAAEDRAGVDTGAVYRPSEIRGVRYDDANGNHTRDEGELGLAGRTIFVDLDRDDFLDAGEPTSTTLADGSYVFTDLATGAYVIREVAEPGYTQTSPTTVGGILWPSGVSNSAVGIVSPTSITTSLAIGASHRETVSLTLPGSGALTNLVDVFLLFDDTGSFVNNSPIVRSAFPDIISQLQASLTGIDLGFGVGRLEEYGNFAYEYATGRPFVLNQPIVAASTTGYMTAIQAALNRTTPGYGGDQPETDIEALYQLVTGRGFDGNNNGSVLDSGFAGLAATQLNPGSSGDVPSFASFTADPANNVLAAAGSVGGAGFRAGALPIVLLATDTGFAYQPKGESIITGVGGVSLPISALTETSRSTTPFNSGAGIQETITALNALGALVIGLGTNPEATFDPRQGLESISRLTGATNRSTLTIDNGTADPIAPGDPFYFQIASGFGASVANGVVNAIQNAVTNVAVDVTLQASDPRVHIINHTGVRYGVGAGQTASFDFEFIGDGVPHRFDLQFVRSGTNVVLGSIPVVIGTPIPGDGYDYEEIDDGEFCVDNDFGDHYSGTIVTNVAPSFTKGADVSVAEDAGLQSFATWATDIAAGPASEAEQVVNFIVANDNNGLFHVQPEIDPSGKLTFQAHDNAYGVATVTVQLHDNGGTAEGGVDTSATQTFTLTISAVNDAPLAVANAYTTAEDTPLVIPASGVLGNDTDVESDPLSAIVVTNPSNGSIAWNADGSFTYIPNPLFNGADAFTYKANDGFADSNVVQVVITVTPVNNPPSATDDTYTTAEDSSLSIPAGGILTNDSDPETYPLSAILVSGPIHGALTLNGDGSFSYIPTPNYNGPDSFTYKANDGTTDSIVATVNISVTAVNDAPVGVGEDFTTSEDTTLAIAAAGVLANDSDPDADPLSAILVSAPTHGALTLNGDGSFSYIPTPNYNGPDSFTYKANDGTADSNVVVVGLTVAAVNDPPVGRNDTYVVNQAAVLTVPATLGVLANDSDVDGDPLTAILATGPTNGSLTLNADGSLSYTPATSFAGTDSFTYRAQDGLVESGLVTVTITVNPVTPIGETKFIVVDSKSRSTYNYDANGNFVLEHALHREDKKPRGIASNPDGSLYWVVDEKGQVFVHNAAGALVGTWECKGVDKPEGIATNGIDLWIVDRETDRVFFFKGAAARRTGSAKATSSFALAKANNNPTDVTTDGVHLWVVNDARQDAVYRYSLRGGLEGSWQIDTANNTPTGLTIDPNNVSNIWIVDAKTDRVYEYTGAAGRVSGQQSAAASFALQSADGDPQGIADPKAGTNHKETPDAARLALAGGTTRRRESHVSQEQKSNVTDAAWSGRRLASSPRSTLAKDDCHDVWDHALRSLTADKDAGTHDSSDDLLETLASEPSRVARRRK